MQHRKADALEKFFNMFLLFFQDGETLDFLKYMSIQLILYIFNHSDINKILNELTSHHTAYL